MAAKDATTPVAPALLEGLPDAVIVADAQGDILYANAAVQSLLGHPPQQLRGRSLTVLMPERFRAAHTAGFARFLVTEEGPLLKATTRVPALHADGREVPIDLTLSPLATGGVGQAGGVVVGVLRDASTTVLLERQLEVSSYLAATLRVTSALAEAPDADTAFTGLLPSLCEQLDWDAATLWQPSPSGDRLIHTGTWTAPGKDLTGWSAASPGRAFAPGEGLPGLAWRRRGPVVIADLGHDERIPRAAAARADGLRTGVAFPLVHGESMLGVCELLSRQVRPVPDELSDVLAGAGRQIGQFLPRLQAEADLRGLADTLQRRLLPARLPTVPGIELAAGYRPAGHGMLVGGDTYDVLPLPEGRWMALIADVCGNGADAAALTALTRHTARAAAAAGGGPAGVLTAVNNALLREQDDGPVRFVTACCLLLHPHEGGADLRLAIAGHPLPLLRAGTGETVEVGATDPALGIDTTTTYRETAVQLTAGDTLVLYTDGVTEARDHAGQQFGDDRLIDVLTHSRTAHAQATVEAITCAVEQHARRSQHRADDLAILVLRLPPPAFP